MATRSRRRALEAPVQAGPITFEDVSRANSNVALMEELHGTDSPQHREAVAERAATIERYRRSRKDGDGEPDAA